MIEITCNDRLGKKVRVKCNGFFCCDEMETEYGQPSYIPRRMLRDGFFVPEDTIGDLKKLIAAQTGTRHDKIVLKKWYQIFKDHVTLGDYEIHDGQNLELYYK